MIYENDAAVVDDHLSSKEDHGLRGFVPGTRQGKRSGQMAVAFDTQGAVSNGDGSRVGCDHSRKSPTEIDEGNRSYETYGLFGNHVDGEHSESAVPWKYPRRVPSGT